MKLFDSGIYDIGIKAPNCFRPRSVRPFFYANGEGTKMAKRKLCASMDDTNDTVEQKTAIKRTRRSARNNNGQETPNYVSLNDAGSEGSRMDNDGDYSLSCSQMPDFEVQVCNVYIER